MGRIKSTELHHFSDASLEGYGQCSYIRMVNEGDRGHGSIVISKARVAPLKQVMIPRLELTAATISARISTFLRSKLTYPEIKDTSGLIVKLYLGTLTTLLNDSIPT